MAGASSAGTRSRSRATSTRRRRRRRSTRAAPPGGARRLVVRSRRRSTGRPRGNLANSVRRPPYGDLAMQQGTWTIRPCPHGEASALAAALGISGITASVLVRRGYGDPEAARAFLAARAAAARPVAARRHGRGRATAIRAAIAAGERICVHGDYDVDGICATALAVTLPARARRERRLAPAEPLRRGLRRSSGQTIERLADEGCGLVLTVDCGITAVEEVARAKALGLDVIVTDHHRPGDDAARTARSSRRGRRATRSRSSAAPASSTSCSARSAADVDTAPRPRRARDDRRRRAAPRREPRACERRPARARAHAEAGPARADARGARRSRDRRHRRGRLPARAADQRRRPARPSGAALELLLTDDRDEASRLASRLEELNRERQQVEERILREAVAQVESWTEAERRRRALRASRARTGTRA